MMLLCWSAYHTPMMLMITALNSQPTSQSRDLLDLPTTDLNLCPEAARSAEFLQLMDGWL